jgi:hypothetical protein
MSFGPVEDNTEKLLSFKGGVNNNSMKVHRISFLEISPNNFIGIANAEDYCYRRFNNYFVLIFVFDISDDDVLIIVAPRGVTMLLLVCY